MANDNKVSAKRWILTTRRSNNQSYNTKDTTLNNLSCIFKPLIVSLTSLMKFVAGMTIEGA